jgi:hypothetical protein
MRIGVDLDNTLIDYGVAFLNAAERIGIVLPNAVRSKDEVREFARSTQDGEKTWQKLQGFAYGCCAPMSARLYPGAMRFLWRCRELGHEVTIVSHKTTYGHQDSQRTPLRVVATNFLISQGIQPGPGELISNLVYHQTLREKVAFINTQSFDWFIDDLPAVILDIDSTIVENTILFDPTQSICNNILNQRDTFRSLANWQQIDSIINNEWTHHEIVQLSYQMLNVQASGVSKLSNGGNGGVYRLSFPDRVDAKLKIYPVDSSHDRLFSDVMVARAIATVESHSVARLIAHDSKLGIGIYDWIEGEPVTLVTQADLESSLSFLAMLNALRNSEYFSNAPPASAACFSGLDIECQIDKRILQFSSARLSNPDLNTFFCDTLLPARGFLLRYARENWPCETGYELPMEKAQRVLSPSDFGFHNAIRCPSGDIIFTDFEYFGFDDPVKLMCDFCFHPGMNLSVEQKSFWLRGALNIYGENVTKRLTVCRPLYGLIWCLILLNDFRSDIWERRLMADESKRLIRDVILTEKLRLAGALIQGLLFDSTIDSKRNALYEA